VHADLVRTSGLEAYLDIGEVPARSLPPACGDIPADPGVRGRGLPEPPQHGEMGDRRSRSRAVQRHPRAVAQVASDGSVYGPLVLRQVSLEQRQVNARDAPCRHESHEAPVRVVAAGDDEQARSVAVEPVHDAGTKLVAAGDAPLQEAVHQGAVLVARCRVHDYAGRLVDDQEPVVLVDDGERDVLGDEPRLAGRRFVDLDALAGPHLVVLGARDAVDARPALGEQVLRLRPRDAGVAGERHVEALARLLRPNDEGARHGGLTGW
jgi:hypothetical protein